MISQQQLTLLLQKREIGLCAPEVLMELPEGPIFHVLMEGHEQALAQWQQARELVAMTGLWPVIVNSKEIVRNSLLFEPIQTKVEATELIRQASEMNTLQMLARELCRSVPIDKLGEIPAVSLEVFSSPEPGMYLPQIEEIMGIWPDLIDPEGFDPEDFLEPYECLSVLNGEETVSLCFLPVEQSWKVAACLRYGGWNACPSSVEHSSVHLFWQERYGAEIACLSRDKIEFFVSRPPTTQQECRKLALEHFAYCDDVVYQGYGSLEALAAHLLRNRIWSFWWD